MEPTSCPKCLCSWKDLYIPSRLGIGAGMGGIILPKVKQWEKNERIEGTKGGEEIYVNVK